MVHALNDPIGMGDDGIRAGGAKIVWPKALENFVRERLAACERKIERGPVRDPPPPRSEAWILLVGQHLDLRGRAVNEQTRIFNDRSTATSSSSVAKFSSVTIGAVHRRG